MKLYKIKGIIDTTSYISIVLNHFIILSIYIALCAYNIKWIYGLPIFLILIGSPIFSLTIADKYNWQDPWNLDDWEVNQMKIKSENKRLKKVIDKQNKLRYAKIL